ncbi:MAG: DUF4198 domain-containing protein [Saprospiraceae bacterium]|nr:DUF4198 domain-containing protein [Saprospiraceae bacterium]
MFLKLDTYFLQPDSASTIHLYNGTFEMSENSITRDRMLDVSIVGPAGRERQGDDQWEDVNSATVLTFMTGEPGTYLAGVSTKARTIDLSADDFNGYLEHDGILDVLDERRKSGNLGDAATELYSKHVKAVLQVGERKTDHYGTVLGYPIEFVPMSNPYDLRVGRLIRVQLLQDGTPLPDQLVYVGHASPGHSHPGGSEHTHGGEKQLRTDKNGIVLPQITEAGHWYLRTIHMEEVGGDELDYQSNWATLTFEVKD